MLRMKARKETTRDGFGAFCIMVREDNFDSVAQRRLAVVRYVTKLSQPYAQEIIGKKVDPFPIQFLGLCGCNTIYESPDELPVDDVRCKHGRLIGFRSIDQETYTKHPFGWKMA